ncbi:MAG: ABC transporter ATP-binding protein [Clostridium sp.]|uniref:ABC transporter ATP-binding protein n=1 Tax=Clostridium sp. TaxID=1506 RepID=UPI003D6D089B
MELKINNLSKQYNKNIWALKDFSLNINDGIVGLLAPNGAGKTTLMKILATVMRPTSGEVQCNGRNIFSLGSEYRNVIGYLPQDFGVYPDFKADDFLNYFAVLKGLDPKTAKKRIDYLLNVVSLTSVRHRKLKTYSGGMKQRMGIAQALLNDPKILIIDEPTVGLDPEERIKFRNLLSELSDNRIVVLSTHIVSDIEAIATSIAFMKDGMLLEYTTPQKSLEMLEGKVYQTLTDVKGANELKKQYIVSNTQNKKNGVLVRVVGDKPCNEAQLVEPTLEDVYLHYYRAMV